MSVKVEASTGSMLEPLDSLRETPVVMQPLHRVWFEVPNSETWYQIMAEARTLYGRNWRGQSHVKRKLDAWHRTDPVAIWFEVPDPAFATWIAVKLGVLVLQRSGK